MEMTTTIQLSHYSKLKMLGNLLNYFQRMTTIDINSPGNGLALANKANANVYNFNRYHPSEREV